MQNERIGDWFSSVSGRKIYVADPRPEDIHLFDIVIGLGNICRFGGQVRKHYSVLQHSRMVASGVAIELLNYDESSCRSEEFSLEYKAAMSSHGAAGDYFRELIRTAALHDASEAYIGDMVKPMKMMGLMEEYRRIEAIWDRVIAEKYGLIYPLPDIVKRHDNRALATEFRDLRPRCEDLNWKCKPEEPYKWKVKAKRQRRENRVNFCADLVRAGIPMELLKGSRL